MARCGCTGTCSCSIVAGTGIDKTGSGSPVDPVRISLDCPEALGCVGAHLGQGLSYDNVAGLIAAKRSADLNNALTFGADGGLKVPAVAAGGVYTADSASVTFSGTGLAGTPLVASVVPGALTGFALGRMKKGFFDVRPNSATAIVESLGTMALTAGRQYRVSINTGYFGDSAGTILAGLFLVPSHDDWRSHPFWGAVPPALNASGFVREFTFASLANEQVGLSVYVRCEGVAANTIMTGQWTLVDEGPNRVGGS